MRNLLHVMKDFFQRSRNVCGMGNRPGRARRRFKGNRGEGTLEFTFVFPMFLLLVFAMIDLGRYYWVKETLENAMRQAGRYAVTGAHVQQGGTNLTRVASITQIAKKAAIGLADNATIQINSIHNGTNVVNSAGGPGDSVTVSMTVTYKFFTPMIGRYFGSGASNIFSVSTTFRNERFPFGQSI